MEKIQIVQIGAGGYGEFYMEEYLSGAHGNITLAGVVDPFIDRCSTHDTLLAKGIPVFDDLEAFYAEHSAELAVIASPIQFHLQQTTVALQNGSHVLCEKPLGATWQEVQQMIAARDAAERFVAIGFQASFSEGCYHGGPAEVRYSTVPGYLCSGALEHRSTGSLGPTSINLGFL